MLQYDGTDGRLRRAQPARVGVHARQSALEDLGKLREAVRTLQRQRAVPDWCAPAEVWRMLLFPSEHCDRGASLSSQFHGQVEARLLHTLVQTRASQRVPTLWNISCPVELDKRNKQAWLQWEAAHSPVVSCRKSLLSSIVGANSAKICTPCLRFRSPPAS